MGQYKNIHSFAPIQYKCGLVQPLLSRICTVDKLQGELETLKYTLMSNGYPASFREAFSV